MPKKTSIQINAQKKQLETLKKLIELYALFKKYKKEYKKVNKIKKKRNILINRIIQRQRTAKGFYATTFLNIKENDQEQFFNHTRMPKEVFDYLLSLCEMYMVKRCIREPIKPQARLALTLVYLSQGSTFKELALSWQLGKETVRQIVYETCDTLWEVLSPTYISEPSESELHDKATEFFQKWNLPNCIGALDGKHITIARPPKSVIQFYKHRKSHSIVLLAACDANHTFTYIDVGGYGSNEDGDIFHVSSFGKKLLSNQLSLPPPRQLPWSDKVLPHFFAADEAFPLHTNILKPYSDKATATDISKSVYNARISKARQTIDNAFGVLVARWKVLSTTLNMRPENAGKIILACIALHNFLKIHPESEKLYIPSNYTDWVDGSDVVHEGQWRSEIGTRLNSISVSRSRHVYNRNTSLAIRNELCDYVNNEGHL